MISAGAVLSLASNSSSEGMVGPCRLAISYCKTEVELGAQLTLTIDLRETLRDVSVRGNTRITFCEGTCELRSKLSRAAPLSPCQPVGLRDRIVFISESAAFKMIHT